MTFTPPHPTRRRLLGRRMTLHIRLRIAAALVLAVATLFGRFALGLQDLPVLGLLGLSVGILAYNALILVLARRAVVPLDRLLFHAAWIDFFALSLTIWFVGGVRSPFLLFFLLHLVVSSMMLSRSASIALGGIAAAMIAGMIGLDLSGLAPAHPLPGDLAAAGPLTWRAALTLAAVYLGAIVGTLLLFTSLGSELRSREERLAQQAAELERLANTRRDFLRVATHNMRSPVAAARMFLTNLDADLAEPLADRQREWVRRAGRRLDELGDFMTEMTRFAALEAGQLEAEHAPVDIAAMLHELASAYGDAADARGIALVVQVPSDLPCPEAMPRLLREAIANFVTNAIKYSPEAGRVTLSAKATDAGVDIAVCDTGPGILEADHKRIFDDFVRLESTDGTKQSGTGLGLAITKRVAEAHGGRVLIDSALGQGACFHLWLPVGKTNVQ